MKFLREENENVWENKEKYIGKLLKFLDGREKPFVIILNIELYQNCDYYVENKDTMHGIIIHTLTIEKIVQKILIFTNFHCHFEEVE